ncbi:MAG: hypothetical protein L0G81_12105, partial [Ewingella sp.]|nr:hypothetical protein [Ewingella sp.]
LTADYLARQPLLMISPKCAADFYRCAMSRLAKQGVATRRGETSPAVSQFLALLAVIGDKPQANGLVEL